MHNASVKYIHTMHHVHAYSTHMRARHTQTSSPHDMRYIHTCTHACIYSHTYTPPAHTHTRITHCAYIHTVHALHARTPYLCTHLHCIITCVLHEMHTCMHCITWRLNCSASRYNTLRTYTHTGVQHTHTYNTYMNALHTHAHITYTHYRHNSHAYRHAGIHAQMVYIQ